MSDGPRRRRWRGIAGRLVAHLARIRYRLLLVNLLTVAVPLAGIFFARFYEREMLRSFEDDMVHQARLVRQVVVGDPQGIRLRAWEPALTRAARDTRTRIRLLDEAGLVVADSHRDGPPEGPDPQPPRYPIPGLPSPPPRRVLEPEQAPTQLAARKEVQKALGGRYGAMIRTWPGGDRTYLFAALPLVVPTRSAEGKVESRVRGVIYVTRSTGPVRFAMHRLRTTLFEILLAALGATVVLSLFLAATISRPLARLSRDARRIAAGDRSVRLDLGGRDEIGDLSRTIDAMTRRLDERARAMAELAANISHEFKSPLTSIRGATELLADGAADDPAARERFLRNILADADRLDRLVTRLLELSRVEADVSPAGWVDLAALAREAASRCAGDPAVEVAAPPDLPRLWGRQAHLAAALGNLVDNARRHAGPGCAVTVALAVVDNGRLRLAVRNRGEPIRPENLPRLWERFFTTRAEEGGTGLGLPIVRSVAVAHGGTVGVSSTAEDGTEFWIDLPLSDGKPDSRG